MIKKFCYIDTETTGLDPTKNGIHEIAGAIVIDGKQKEEFEFKVSPFPSDQIEDKALEIAKVTRDQIMSYEEPLETHNRLIEILGRYVDKFDKTDKFWFVAYNSPFDNEFMRSWFEKCGDKYFGSWFRLDICVMRVAIHRLLLKNVQLDNYKLSSVAQHLGIAEPDDERWHSSKFDIYVTREILKRVSV